jgi:hypothetical protein
MRQRIGTYITTRPLRCERCHRRRLDPQITVAPGLVEKRRRDGRYRDHASAFCSNGHQWWSIHPQAIRQAQQADARSAVPVERSQSL